MRNFHMIHTQKIEFASHPKELSRIKSSFLDFCIEKEIELEGRTLKEKMGIIDRIIEKCLNGKGDIVYVDNEDGFGYMICLYHDDSSGELFFGYHDSRDIPISRVSFLNFLQTIKQKSGISLFWYPYCKRKNNERYTLYTTKILGFKENKEKKRFEFIL